MRDTLTDTADMPREPAARPAWFGAAALCSAALIIGLRLYQLATLQNELYGDIELDHERFERVLTGQWPFDFVLSVGPLYHYLTAPVVALIGTSYASLKLTAAIVSLFILLATFALARRLVGETFGLLAVTVAGVSSWLLVWSRLGNSPVVVPLLTSTALWLMVRYAQLGRRRDGVACGLVAALGLYAFPQAFVLPGVVVATLACLRWTGHRITWRGIGLVALVSAAGALPFLWIVWSNPVTFTTGYVGSKFITSENPLLAFGQNVLSGALAFHVHGDTNFRANPPGLPHLDALSGALMLAGAVFWLLPERRRLSPAILLPLVLLQLPSILVLGRPGEVPSATRTLGVAPLVYILVASGIWWLAGALRTIRRPRLGAAVALALLAAILGLNVERYFGSYIGGLPYQNTSISAEIAAYADRLPPETQVYIAGCCWESSMPETPFVKLVVRRPDNVREIDPAALSCASLPALEQPAVLIWSFRDALPAERLAECRFWLPAQLFLSPPGVPVFHAAPLRLDAGPPGPTPTPAPRPPEGMSETQLLYDGEPAALWISALDIGSPADLFDGNPATLVRGHGVNPLVVELRLERPREVRGVALDLATMTQVRIRVELSADGAPVTSVTREYDSLPDDPRVELELPGGPYEASAVRVLIEDLRPKPPEGYYVHLRGFELR